MIAARFADALRPRIYPNTPLHLEQLAAPAGISPFQLRRYYRGESKIDAEVIGSLDRFFKSRGDHRFAAEVYGIEAPPADETLRSLVKTVLAERRSAERCLWISPEGMKDAPEGHEAYARQQLGLPSSIEGDCCRYLMVNLGWIEAAIDGEGRVRLRYVAKGLKPQASASALDWLLGQRDEIAAVSRAVEIGGEWATARNMTVDAVADELMLAARIEPMRRPRNDPRSLDEIESPHMGALIRGWRDSPQTALNVAGAIGVTPRLSIYAVEGDDVTCRWLGPGLSALPRKAVGANVLAWPDPRYGANLRRRILAADREGPTFTSLEMPVFGNWLAFDALSFPIGGGEVATVTERRAAA